LNESVKAISSIFTQIDDKQSKDLETQMKSAKDELKKLQRNILGLNLNNFSMTQNFTANDNFNENLGVSGYLYLNQEVLKKREAENKPGKASLKRLQEAFKTDMFDDKMQTLKDIEELIYIMINNPNKMVDEEMELSVDKDASYQSLSDKIRELIRHDRGFSLVNSSNSGGIPSPIRESDSFKKLIDFKDNTGTSEFNSRKVKKIEFSDTMTKENKHKTKKKENEKGEVNFTHSSMDRMIFNDTYELDSRLAAGLGEFGDGSIAETVKRSGSKPLLEDSKGINHKDPVIEQSFENPHELSHEVKKYSLRSSIDEKFFGLINHKHIEDRDLNIPSINNSLVEYPSTWNPHNRIIENKDIQHQDSSSRKDNSTLKQKNQDKINEKKATKKEFERENHRDNKQDDVDPDDRSSTLKKVELKEAIKHESNPEKGIDAYRNLATQIGHNGN
jgi:hypothetical protein